MDSSIRDWVLLPIVTVMILVGLLRHYVTVMMKSEIKVEEKTVRQKFVLERSRLLRENASHIPERIFLARRVMFVKPDGGLLHEKV